MIRGSLQTQHARLGESPVTGMVIDQLAAVARFSGPQLIFSQISGKTTGGGSITGGGSVTFSGGNALLDLKFDTDQAMLLDRDDVAARVSGPLNIRSNANGGTRFLAISGSTKAGSNWVTQAPRQPSRNSTFARPVSIPKT